ncbi:MAG TPA: hypothetical protein VFK85_11160, partial [Anaeromyxobacteraceae bacterium]|nr:hypothetical protein [Anaeromyxobacteraceae bacterium]
MMREQPTARDTAEPRARADAARKSAAAAATPGAGLGVRAAVPAEGAAASRGLVADVERRLAAGALVSSSRKLTCAGEPVDQVSWADGARVLKVALRVPGGGEVVGWYDGAGRLRAVTTVSSDGGATVHRLIDGSGRVVHEDRSGGTSDDAARWLDAHEPRAACEE